jgi:hypothetical protein
MFAVCPGHLENTVGSFKGDNNALFIARLAACDGRAVLDLH